KRCDFFGRFLDQATLFVLGENVLALAIRAAMTDDLVAARLDALKDLWVITQHTRVGVVRGWEPHLIQQIEEVPLANAIAVIAPGEISVRLGGVQRGAVASKTIAVAEYLDIVAHAHGQALAARPFIFRPLR